jgi:hypothetical protein
MHSWLKTDPSHKVSFRKETFPWHRSTLTKSLKRMTFPKKVGRHGTVRFSCSA